MEMLKEAGSIILAVLALMVLVAGAATVYFFRGKKVERLSAAEETAKQRVKEAEKAGDTEALRKEILEKVRKARGR